MIVGHHDDGLVATAAEGVDDVFHQTAVAVVEPVERFVEDEQLRVLDKGPGEEDETLLAA